MKPNVISHAPCLPADRLARTATAVAVSTTASIELDHLADRLRCGKAPLATAIILYVIEMGHIPTKVLDIIRCIPHRQSRVFAERVEALLNPEQTTAPKPPTTKRKRRTKAEILAAYRVQLPTVPTT